MSKVYILQKDLPFVEKGTKYFRVQPGMNVDSNSFVPDRLGMAHERFAIHKDYVEDNPEWFLEEPIPIEKTEEGNPVFEGDSLFQVSIVGEWTVHESKARKEIVPFPSYFKYFSTKEAAEDYIVENKPCLSIKDIASVTLVHDPSFLFKRLEELVKSKIKNDQ